MPGSVSAALACATAVGAAAWAVRGRSSAVFAPSVWRGKPGRKAIALTFDDGPSRGTPELLKRLADYGVPATFFLIGSNTEAFPDIAQATVAAGHEIEITLTRTSNLALTRPTFIEAEFQRAQNAIERVDQSLSPLCSRPLRRPVVRVSPDAGAPGPYGRNVVYHRTGLEAPGRGHFRACSLPCQ